MKFLLLIAGVLFLQMTRIQCDKKVFEECTKEFGITEDMLKEESEVNRGKPEFKCLAACVMKKNGHLEAGNVVNVDKFKKNIPIKLADKAVELVQAFQECTETAKDNVDECDFANAIGECLHNKFPIESKDAL